MLADLLTAEEVAALLLLMTSLGTARHGPELVAKQIVGADLMVALGVAMQESVKGGGKPVDLEAVMESSMKRGGNEPPG